MASRVTVRMVDGEERVHISLRYGLDGKKERIFNVDRLQNEELGKCLTRLQANVTNKLSKSRRKKKKKVTEHDTGAAAEEQETDEHLVELGLFRNNVRIEETVLNKDAWREGSVLQIAFEKLPIIFNPPKVKSMKLQECFMAGFPIFPRLQLEFVDLESCEMCWYVGKVNQEKSTKNGNSKKSCTENAVEASDTEVQKCNGDVGNSQKKNKQSGTKDIVKTVKEWIMVSTERVFTPLNAHINHRLKLTCTPRNSTMTGDEVSIEPEMEIEAGPGKCPFEKRCEHTKDLTPSGSFRVVSYNILADLYADSDFSRNVLYPYCPPYALHIDYRKQLFVKELQCYNADLICLQEVDRKVFINDIRPFFEMLGLESLHRSKAGEVNEGMVTCFRMSKFKLLGQHDITLTEELKNNAALTVLYEKVSANESLTEKVFSRTTVLQVTVLESLDVPGEVVCVANTHLFFHPKANHVRLIQIITCMEHLNKVKSHYTQQGKQVSLVFCGDFNSVPPVGVNEYMTTGQISADHTDWTVGGAEETLDLEDGFRHPFVMESGCGYPVYTNFVGGFCGTLDYVYVDTSGLKVQSVVPNPDEEDVTLHTALPSIVFPSDHIAQVCDVEFRK
ncbi:2',5'-phosphodiesterase 12-like [Liolophura sinensis]|uniref:2',5'-phosphodiesterase 12-like n=1 Tax=Liolophura sinensis TaxID=3198878 RepID=UPI003158874C